MTSIFKIFGIAVVTIFYSVLATLSMPFDRRGRTYFALARRWSRSFLFVSNIKLEVEGSEHLQPDESYVYAANHSSYFDIPALLAGIDDRIRIIYKRELERIPVFGWQLRLSPFIGVDRSNPRDGMQSIARATEAIRSGSSVLVFPEGTRSTDGRLAAFKRGAFLLAARAQKPIVPVALVGSASIMEAGSSKIRSGTIRLCIGKPIPALATPGKEQERAAMEQVRYAIAQLLNSKESANQSPKFEHNS